MIDASKYTAHKSPGKFEGETAASEYFYEQMLNGDGEELYSDDEGGAVASVFRIDADESEAFGLPIGGYFLLREDSQGFVMGSTHATQEAAEGAFRRWCGN
jgi:hypothetical protein